MASSATETTAWPTRTSGGLTTLTTPRRLRLAKEQTGRHIGTVGRMWPARGRCPRAGRSGRRWGRAPPASRRSRVRLRATRRRQREPTTSGWRSSPAMIVGQTDVRLMVVSQCRLRSGSWWICAHPQPE